jgi:carbohydrate-binding DOMON domain-containing protein
MREILRNIAVAAFAFLLVAAVAPAQDVCFDDPANDDNGPGGYVYPTDSVYINGSFDLTQFCLKVKGNKANAEVSVNSNLQDPWRMGVGFSVQMVFIYIDNAEGGNTMGLPGTNHMCPEDQAWDKVIILSPQQIGRVNQEVEAKAADVKDDVVVPSRTKGAGRTISGSVKMADLGEGDPSTWGYQVIMQSNEGFPAEGDLLTRKVNEFEGQHRFGGGTDYDCDPHVMDILGDQAAWLAYECEADGTAKKMATVGMVKQ